MLEERINIVKIIKNIKDFIFYLFRRYSQNRSSSVAAELTVTSLLAIVPFTTVVFGILVFNPEFKQSIGDLQSKFFEYFVPSTGSVIQTYINEFVSKASRLSGFGITMLFITALMMIRTIDISFNKIWQFNVKKSITKTFLIYSLVLIFGPILLVFSLLFSAYLKSLIAASDVVDEYTQSLSFMLPFFVAILVFSLIYKFVPNRKIKFLHAFSAGILTAVLFEIAKFSFGIFVAKFSTYQLIFGALAVIPLFLIWIYFSWSIVLLGAEFCHALESFSLTRKRDKEEPFIEILRLLILLTEENALHKKLNERVLFDLLKEQKIDTYWLDKLLEGGLLIKQEQAKKLFTQNKQIFYYLNKDYLINNVANHLGNKVDYLTIYRLAENKLPSPESIQNAYLSDSNKSELLILLQNFDKLLTAHSIMINRPVI